MPSSSNGLDLLKNHPDVFVNRHIGVGPDEEAKMLKAIGCSSVDQLIEQTVPSSIRLKKNLEFSKSALTEMQVLEHLRGLSKKNQVFRSFIGMGYADCITPPVILRNILENPGWYTQYTPYQAEISQGRLEALLNFQTMVADLSGLPISNASLLDEATAAAEAMVMAYSLKNRAPGRAFLVDEATHPQTIAVVKTRAEALGISVEVSPVDSADLSKNYFGILIQYPDTRGSVRDFAKLATQVHAKDGIVVVAADPLALVLYESPGSWGADIVVGSTQRFGVPMGFGGPHAGYLATKDEFKRLIPGRLIGLSKDADGRPAARLALQTREQHIRRDKATSNICTAQVLLAITASMYAVYHGPKGLKKIASRVRGLGHALREKLRAQGHSVLDGEIFDTVCLKMKSAAELEKVISAALRFQMNFRKISATEIGISLDETTSVADWVDVLSCFGPATEKDLDAVAGKISMDAPAAHARKTPILTHPVFHRYHSEHEMLRYMTKLQSRDLSLTSSMIPLGSCTMKLNAAAEMMPITWPEFSRIHPFAPKEQVEGYLEMIVGLEKLLEEITGFQKVSLQPNSGAQGEYAGLLVIRAYHQSRGDHARNICLIPQSAHGTNPASAALAGMQVVVVACDSNGNIDVADLKAKAQANKDRLAALMVTYPSTHGVFEEPIKEICETIHAYGGQVYMDGANMNAQVGLCSPGEIGADVCHLNLHKTFCIPHGGGGPGMGPIGVRAHLAEFLPGHPVVKTGGNKAIGPVSAAPWGSPSILPIPYAYILMMGPAGLKRATEIAILSANYIAARLAPHFPVLYRGSKGRVAHECIVDLRQLKATSGVEVEDVAKRLMDYGFHAPTISFPVAGTMMIEPTESESLREIDRFCDAMIQIRAEIAEIESGKADRAKNLLKLAPHTSSQVMSDSWDRPYSRERAAFPVPGLRDNKFWPPVARVDGVYGDRNLFCTCAPMDEA
ncbi:MAG: aminomethyl-transferring glycine dehydrogenase [Bdellovibrionales bacterium]|nr:aminomethyl-transferring glycine dehydrogenase [Bdellovibrionales bacterium]